MICPSVQQAHSIDSLHLTLPPDSLLLLVLMFASGCSSKVLTPKALEATLADLVGERRFLVEEEASARVESAESLLSRFWL